MSTSPVTTGAGSQSGMVDPLVDSLFDFSEYDRGVSYGTPSLSPDPTKAAFVKPIKVEATPASLLPASQPMSGPSHQYDLYKQQTGIVPGALASTLAVNQNNSQIQGYNVNIDYMGLGNTDNVFDFNSTPSQGSMTASAVDMEFESPPPDHSFFFGDSTVNPSTIGGQGPTMQSPSTLSSQSGNIGRLWPGMHQQAALAKAQAQQRQQQQIIQQQQQQRQHVQAQQHKPQRSKNSQPADPIVEQKITQLLNSMRVKQAAGESADDMPLTNISRPRKEEDEMDEDERLLASEEGKKLSSKERRQLRNKVSARAFRSRRKEYISQLEAEIANKVNENGDLRRQNKSILEENKRLTDLTHMLLSSPSFSNFLDHLSQNPQQLPQAQQPVAQQHQSRQLPKDVNPCSAQQQIQQPQHQHPSHVNMALISEQPADYSVMSLDSSDGFTYQPQVYAVLETPEPPVLDVSVLSGKTSNLVGARFESDDEKVEMPVIEQPPVFQDTAAAADEEVEAAVTEVDEEFENDPAFALYHDSAPSSASAAVSEAAEPGTDSLFPVNIFSGIEPEKVLARYELVAASEEDAAASLAMARVQHISASLESVMSRLELLTIDI